MSTVSNKQGGMSGEFEVNEGTSGAAAYDFVQVRENQENVLLVLLVKNKDVLLLATAFKSRHSRLSHQHSASVVLITKCT